MLPLILLFLFSKPVLKSLHENSEKIGKHFKRKEGPGTARCALELFRPPFTTIATHLFKNDE